MYHMHTQNIMTPNNNDNNDSSSNNNTRNQHLRKNLKQSMHHRVASLTPAEAFFLHGLLVDEAAMNGQLENACKRLDDDILFSTLPPTLLPPFLKTSSSSSSSGAAAAAAAAGTTVMDNNYEQQDGGPQPPPYPHPRPFLPSSHRKANRHSTVGLWKAHQDGVAPEQLRSKSSGATPSSCDFDGIMHSKELAATEDVSPPVVVTTISPAAAPPPAAAAAAAAPAILAPAAVGNSSSDYANIERERSAADDDRSIASDVEVRPDHHHHIGNNKDDTNNNDNDSIATASSWDEAEHTENFDAWEVLRDEYAQDFGFDYSQRHVTMESIINGNDENEGNTFEILGTSVNDTSAQPHVLSPPLMDALVSIIGQTICPELNGQNFWLRYSLIRDGASIQTLKQYVRAAKYTILAIETRSGNVFGSFTSSPWRNSLSFYGGPPAFVWKMRHSRRTKCASLFDQAQMESEIDVFMCANANSMCQVCRHDSLAIGGDDGGGWHNNNDMAGEEGQDQEEDDHFKVPAAMEDLAQGGFAFYLEEDLMCGTTSPCATFTSPALYGKGDRSNVFDVAGLEIWSFTPCHDVKSAEKLEMTQFFIEESTRGSHYSTSSSHRSVPSTDSSSMFTSRDLIQEDFYRRVGQDVEGDERRQRWQYANMMNPMGGGGGARGFGATPRYGYSNGAD